MKKALMALLALMLALSLVPALGEEAQTDFGRFEEPVSIRFLGLDGAAGVVTYDSSNPDRTSASANAYISGYEEYMNLKVERIVAEDTNALNALINTAMASDTLPDVLDVSASMFNILAENGVLADLTDAYNNYAQKNITKYIVDSFPDRITAGYRDGQWLGFPAGQLYSDAEMLWVRTDWLTKVGMELPKTMEDVVAIARAFKEAKLGGENTEPLGMTGFNGTPAYSDLTSFAAGYGVVLNTWNKGVDGKYSLQILIPEMSEVLLALQSMYAEGLIKSDFAVTNILTEEVTNGVCGMFYGPEWYGVTVIQASLNADPNAQWMPVLLPSVTGERVEQYTKALPQQYFVVTKNCEHPEALMMMIEFGLHMKYEGTAEESARFNVCDDGFQMHNLSVTRNIIRPDEGLIKYQAIKEGLDSGADSVINLANSDFLNIKAAIGGDRSQEGRRLTWMVSRANIYQLGAEHPELFRIAYAGPTTENMSLYLETINAALANAMMKVVMGADISVYEDAVNTWYQTGGQTITDEVNAYYASNE